MNASGFNDDEQCDDGNLLNGDGCNAFCKHEYCGDGVTGDNELCDTGRFCSNGSGCTTNPWICPGDCKTRLVGDCTPDCTYGSCGDGVVDPDGADNNPATIGDNEDCDNGKFCPNGVPCTNNPTLCPGQCITVFTTTCLATCKALYCGDGYVDLDGPDNILGTADDEQCDDGNTFLGDGCSNTCELEISLCREGEYTCPP